MDSDARRLVMYKLREMCGGRRSRIALQVAPGPENEGARANLSDFPSRQEFRKALILRMRGEGRDALRDLAHRLQTLVLTVTPAELSRVLLIEGNMCELEVAMSESEVARAIPDASVTREESDEDMSCAGRFDFSDLLRAEEQPKLNCSLRQCSNIGG